MKRHPPKEMLEKVRQQEHSISTYCKYAMCVCVSNHTHNLYVTGYITYKCKKQYNYSTTAIPDQPVILGLYN